jgi:hypothetical protein
MVALSITGMSNKAIGEYLEYSPVQVGNILRSPEAMKLKGMYIDKVRGASVEGSIKSLDDIKHKAIQRVSDVIMNDELAKDAPFRVADFSARVLTGIGTLSQAGGTPAQPVTNIMIGNDIASKLFAGLEMAKKAKQLNAPKDPNEIVVEGE